MSPPAATDRPPVEAGTLYVVATPIGNLEDITLRAARVLGAVDRILCEDTRVTRFLCDHLGVSAPLLRHDAHTEARSTAGALALLAAGESLALVSDAGTPGVSDPGQRLVREAAAAGHTVVPIPGASAVTAAVSASGVDAAGFTFGGFLPKARGALEATFAGLAPGCHVFFAPARDLVGVSAAAAGAPHVAELVVARELTKRHESWYRGAPAEVAATIAADPDAVRGEAVVIAVARAVAVDDAAILAALARSIAAGATQRDAVAEVAEALGVKRRRVYQLALSESGAG